jgi:hypothetical protein
MMSGRKSAAVFLPLILSAALIVCGKSGTPAAQKPAVRFKTFSCVDRSGTGIEAFRMLIPAEWRFEGGVTWRLDNPGMPAVAGFRVSNPAGHEEFEVFPNQPFFWTDNPMLRQMFPPGSRYFGNEVRPPVGPVEALKKIALPRFRGKGQRLKVVREEHLPELAKALGAGVQRQPGISAAADGARIRIEYQRDGLTMEEELYGLVEAYGFPVQSMAGTFTNTMWTVSYLFSFKAERGHLDERAPLFTTMTSSFRLNPQWFSKVNQVVEYLISRQIQHIRNVGELSRILSRTSNEISEQMMQSYEERQKVYDRVSENFSQHIRGVDEYYDPVGERRVELPAGYRQAWTNALGEYIVSESEDFNPNVGSNQNWQKMEKK